MKRILFNASEKEERRFALVNGQTLDDIYIEHVGSEPNKDNIYLGIITRIEPSLEAAFVDYGADRHGFLPLKEVSKEFFRQGVDESKRPSIKDCLREGQTLLVQIEKEERGNKGAALTTFISLAGCYLVLMPNNPRAGGISRRIEGEEREELKDIINKLAVPEPMGLIVRTAGLGKSLEELEWDLSYLLHIWQAIQQAASERAAPYLIHQESDVVVRAIRDHLKRDIGEILIDNTELYEKAKNYVHMLRPDASHRVKLYNDPIPLFSRFQIEAQIESAFQREVSLPSGGALVIDHTEALVTIDINSAKATRGGDIEETALNTNLEAAEEIGRQLRIRDLGGLIVIDFIDMTPTRNQREVENRLRESLKLDRARVQVGRISRFGLLEMSRQRLRPSLGEAVQQVCPRCSGQGIIRGVESLALSIMRLIGEEALKENTASVQAQLPVELATFLLNEKRASLATLEERHKIAVLIIPNPHMQTPAFEITRIKIEESGDSGSNDNSRQSYRMVQQQPDQSSVIGKASTARKEPAVKQITPPPLARTSTTGKGLIKRLWSSLFGSRNLPIPYEASTAAETAEQDNERKPSEKQSPNRTRNSNKSRPHRRNSSKNRAKTATADSDADLVSDKQEKEEANKDKNSDTRKQPRERDKRDRSARTQSNRRSRKSDESREKRTRSSNKGNELQNKETAQQDSQDSSLSSTKNNAAIASEQQPIAQQHSSVVTAGSAVTKESKTSAAVYITPEQRKAEDDQPLGQGPSSHYGQLLQQTAKQQQQPPVSMTETSATETTAGTASDHSTKNEASKTAAEPSNVSPATAATPTESDDTSSTENVPDSSRKRRTSPSRSSRGHAAQRRRRIQQETENKLDSTETSHEDGSPPTSSTLSQQQDNNAAAVTAVAAEKVTPAAATTVETHSAVNHSQEHQQLASTSQYDDSATTADNLAIEQTLMTKTDTVEVHAAADTERNGHSHYQNLQEESK